MRSRLTKILGSNFSVVRVRTWATHGSLSIVNISQAMDNPFAPLFAEKRVLKLVEPFPGQFWTINSPKCPKRRFQVKHFPAFYCRCKISAFKVRGCSKCKISWHSSLDVYLSFVSSLFFFAGKRQFYSCGLSTLAFEWMWGWGWRCFDTNLLCFVMEIVFEKY